MPRASKLKSVGGKLVSAKSKTGNPECSAAMSAWVKNRKTGSVPPGVFAILGKCRAQARQNRGASAKQAAGKLAAGRGTWQRSEQAKAMLAQRAARRAPAPAAASGGFALKQDSAAGKKATTFSSSGGRTGTMFDMKKGDLKGQTSIFDKVATVPTVDPRLAARKARLQRAGSRPGEEGMTAFARAKAVKGARAKLEAARTARTKAQEKAQTKAYAKAKAMTSATVKGRDRAEAAKAKATATAAAKVKPAKVAPSRSTPERAALAAQLKSAHRTSDRDLRYDKVSALKGHRDLARSMSSDSRGVKPEHHKRLDAAFDELNAKNKGSNFIHILDLRRKFPDLSRPQFDAMLREARVAGKYSGNEHEGLHGKLTKAQKKAGIRDAGANLVYLSRRH